MSSNHRAAAETFKTISVLYNNSGRISASIDYENKSLISLKEYNKKLALEATKGLQQRLEVEKNKSTISYDLWNAVQKNIANIKSLNNQHEEAVEIFQKISDSILTFEKIEENRTALINNQLEISKTNEKMGRQIQSILDLESFVIYLSYTKEKTKYYEKLSELYRAIGNFQKSNYYLFELLEIVDNGSHVHAIYLNSIGSNFSKLMNPEMAIQFYLKSLDIRKELVGSNAPLLGIVYHNLANMYKLIGKRNESITFYQKALNNYQLAYGEPSADVGFVYNSLGNFYFDEADYALALSFYQKGLNNRTKVLQLNNPFVIHSYYNMANSFLRIGLIDSAQQYINYALTFNPLSQEKQDLSSAFEHIDYLKDYAFAKWLKGEICFANHLSGGDLILLEIALSAYKESVELYYQILRILDQENSKLSYVESLKNSIIGSLKCQIKIDHIKGKKDFESVYNLFEKSHNSQLFELIKNATPNNRNLLAKDSILNIISYKRELEMFTNSDTTNYKKNTEMVVDLSNKIDRLDNWKNNSFESLINDDNTFIGYKNFKRELDEGNIVVQFLVSPLTNQVFYFSFSKRWSDYGYLSTYHKMDSICRKFNSSVRRFEYVEKEIFSKAILNTIEAAFPPDIGTYKQVIVIPDGFFWQLPFDAISSPINNDRYFVEDFDISLHLSCNLLSSDLKNDKSYHYEFVGFAPFSSSSFEGAFESIPSTAIEINQAYRTIDKSLVSYCLIDSAANFNNFIEYSQGARVIHFATHFDYNSGSSLKGLLLSPTMSQRAPEYIGYQEVLVSKTSPELVVLSACNSGAAITQFDGEGPINLNRAFIMNGTKNIIYSVNKINDKFSEVFFRIFYQSLVEEMDYKRSFQRTKRELIKDPVYSHPFFWSSFQIIASQ